MKKRVFKRFVFLIALTIGIVMMNEVSAVNYLPDVTLDMVDANYWSSDDEILINYDEIKELNALTILTEGTNMNDLKNQPETIDGKALNERLKKSSEADANYYLGWTYLGSEKLATKNDYDKLIRNTQNKRPSSKQKVRYAVAIKRTELRAFPSPLPIWDDLKDLDFDYQYLVGVRVNEPLVITSVSADGKYYLAKNVCCSGWVPKEDVAICKDKEEWLNAWDIPSEEALVVYGDKVYTETSITGFETSDLRLTMGTVLKLAKVTDTNTLIDNRATYNNYVVWIPTRDKNGNYQKKMTLIPEQEKVSIGYLPLTRENIAKVSLDALGNTYGWGGALNSDDCSGYIRNIYKCFGLELARNTTWQTAMPIAKVNLDGMCREERIKILDKLPLGSILYFSGHEMLYLGSENGKYYVISAVGSIMNPYESETKQRIRSTIINTLDIKRANGKTWLDSLTTANVPYWGLLDGKSYEIPQYEWYHDGVTYCLNNKLMECNKDGMFYPDNQVTRAEFVQILWNLAGKPVVNYALPFTDIEDDAGYLEAVRWATSTNLLSGYDEKTFAPNLPVNREQLASILYKYAQSEGKGFSGLWMFKLDFEDIGEISEYAYEPLCWLTMNEVLSGIDSTHIAPKALATRAQVAVIMEKFVDKIHNTL